MAVTILEALQNAKYNLETAGGVPMIRDLALGQLTNAVTLLEKDYPLDTEVEPLLEEFDDVRAVPRYSEYIKPEFT